KEPQPDPVAACVGTDAGPRIVQLVDDPGSLDGGAPLTWDGWAGQFVNAYCVGCHNPAASCGGNGCHAPGDPKMLDFRQKKQVAERASVVRCGIAETQDASWHCNGVEPAVFPKANGTCTNAFPTARQRQFLIDWINAGTP